MSKTDVLAKPCIAAATALALMHVASTRKARCGDTADAKGNKLQAGRFCFRAGTSLKDVAAACGLDKKNTLREASKLGLSQQWHSPLSSVEFQRFVDALPFEPHPCKSHKHKPTLAPRFQFQQSRNTSGPSREIICKDVKQWLHEQGDSFPEGMSVVTSMPDVTETPYDLPEWKVWFVEMARLIMSRLRPGQCAIFYLSDIKVHSKKTKRCLELVHKVGLVADAASKVEGMKLFWQKVATYTPLGKQQVMGVGRPQLTHLVCWCKEYEDCYASTLHAHDPRTAPSRASYDGRRSLSPDLFDRGRQIWSKGMGIQGCHIMLDFLAQQDHPPVTSVACLFCGMGTAPAMANAVGLDAIGVEWSSHRCSKAEQLEFRLDEVVRYRKSTGTLPV